MQHLGGSRTRTVLDDDSRASDPAEVAEVDLMNQIRNLRSTTACSGRVDSLVRSSSGSHVGERTREGEGMAQGGGEVSPRGLCALSSSWVPSLYRGRGEVKPP